MDFPEARKLALRTVVRQFMEFSNVGTKELAVAYIVEAGGDSQIAISRCLNHEIDANDVVPPGAPQHTFEELDDTERDEIVEAVVEAVYYQVQALEEIVERASHDVVHHEATATVGGDVMPHDNGYQRLVQRGIGREGEEMAVNVQAPFTEGQYGAGVGGSAGTDVPGLVRMIVDLVCRGLSAGWEAVKDLVGMLMQMLRNVWGGGGGGSAREGTPLIYGAEGPQDGSVEQLLAILDEPDAGRGALQERVANGEWGLGPDIVPREAAVDAQAEVVAADAQQFGRFVDYAQKVWNLPASVPLPRCLNVSLKMTCAMAGHVGTVLVIYIEKYGSSQYVGGQPDGAAHVKSAGCARCYPLAGLAPLPSVPGPNEATVEGDVGEAGGRSAGAGGSAEQAPNVGNGYPALDDDRIVTMGVVGEDEPDALAAGQPLWWGATVYPDMAKYDGASEASEVIKMLRVGFVSLLDANGEPQSGSSIQLPVAVCCGSLCLEPAYGEGIGGLHFLGGVCGSGVRSGDALVGAIRVAFEMLGTGVSIAGSRPAASEGDRSSHSRVGGSSGIDSSSVLSEQDSAYLDCSVSSYADVVKAEKKSSVEETSDLLSDRFSQYVKELHARRRPIWQVPRVPAQEASETGAEVETHGSAPAVERDVRPISVAIRGANSQKRSAFRHDAVLGDAMVFALAEMQVPYGSGGFVLRVGHDAYGSTKADDMSIPLMDVVDRHRGVIFHLEEVAVQ